MSFNHFMKKIICIKLVHACLAQNISITHTHSLTTVNVRIYSINCPGFVPDLFNLPKP